LQRARKPQIRDLALAGKQAPAARQPINTDQAIANLTRLLLPGAIATALTQVKNLIVVPVLDIGTVPFAVLQPFETRDNADRQHVNFRCAEPFRHYSRKARTMVSQNSTTL
jgi:hypothetical protein